MRLTSTDGTESDVPDMCDCCHLSTGGEHELNCPVSKLRIGKESYADYVARRKAEIDAHPEWGITYL